MSWVFHSAQICSHVLRIFQCGCKRAGKTSQPCSRTRSGAAALACAGSAPWPPLGAFPLFVHSSSSSGCTVEAGRALEEHISLIFKFELHILTEQEKMKQAFLSLLLLKRAWGICSGERLKEQIVPAQLLASPQAIQKVLQKLGRNCPELTLSRPLAASAI